MNDCIIIKDDRGFEFGDFADYKSVIEQFEEVSCGNGACHGCWYCKEAASSIKLLLTERNALIRALENKSLGEEC